MGSKKPFNDLSIRKLPAGVHSDAGAPNLYLSVSEAGNRSWLFRFHRTINGKKVRRTMGLGPLHAVGLKEAREKAAAMRNLLWNDVDPYLEKKASRAPRKEIPTFDEMAKAFIEKESPGWQNPKHKSQWENTLKTYACPHIGAMPVNLIEVGHIRDLLMADNFWVEKTESAKRVRGRIELVLNYAAALGHRSKENPADWKTSLKHLLAAPQKVQVRRPMPALPYQEMPAFMAALKARDGLSARALEFVILTGSRSGAVRLAEWLEIDLINKVWICPGSHMKSKKEHRVPLSENCISLLKAIKPENAEGLIFPGRLGSALSDMSLSKVVRTMPGSWVDPKQNNAKIVVHGFRSTFRDWASETNRFSHDIIEAALAQTAENKTVSAYDRSDRLELRRPMMQEWARFIFGD